MHCSQLVGTYMDASHQSKGGMMGGFHLPLAFPSNQPETGHLWKRKTHNGATIWLFGVERIGGQCSPSHRHTSNSKAIPLPVRSVPGLGQPWSLTSLRVIPQTSCPKECLLRVLSGCPLLPLPEREQGRFIPRACHCTNIWNKYAQDYDPPFGH